MSINHRNQFKNGRQGLPFRLEKKFTQITYIGRQQNKILDNVSVQFVFHFTLLQNSEFLGR